MMIWPYGHAACIAGGLIVAVGVAGPASVDFGTSIDGRGVALVVPLGVRSVAAVVGAVLVLTAGASVIETLIVPRAVSSWLTRWVDRIVTGAFRVATGAIGDYRRRDRVLAVQAAAILLAQLAAWLGISFVGYWLLLWPFVTGGVMSAFTAAGSSLFTLGFAEPAGAAPAAIVFAAAATGLGIVTLQIAYLPTLYAAFNRRETEWHC